MERFNIKIDRPPLDSSEVQATRDFDQLYAAYQTQGKPWFKGWAFWGVTGLASVAVVLSVYWWLAADEPAAVHQEQANGATALPVVPPESSQAWREGAFPFTQYTLNAAVGGQIRHSSGSVLHIPPGAFQRTDGQSVTGMISLYYREAHHPLDLFLAAVPVGKPAQDGPSGMESAGLLQVKADQEGHPLQLQQEQAIRVEMATFDQRSGFEWHLLDTGAMGWKFLADSRAQLREGLEPEDLVTDPAPQPAAVDEAEKPAQVLEPEQAAADARLFYFDNLDHYPELSAYENVGFQVDAVRSGFDSTDYHVAWEVEQFVRVEETGDYRLTLRADGREKEVFVRPVFAPDHYPEAQQRYAEAVTHWRIGRETGQPDSATPLIRHDASTVTTGSRVASGAAAYVRSVAVTQLGAYQAMRFRQPEALAAKPPVWSLSDQRKPQSPGVFYWSHPGQNVLFRSAAKGNELALPAPGAIFWTVTADNQLAIGYPQEADAASAPDFTILPLSEGLSRLRTQLALPPSLK